MLLYILAKSLVDQKNLLGIALRLEQIMFTGDISLFCAVRDDQNETRRTQTPTILDPTLELLSISIFGSDSTPSSVLYSRLG